MARVLSKATVNCNVRQVRGREKRKRLKHAASIAALTLPWPSFIERAPTPSRKTEGIEEDESKTQSEGRRGFRGLSGGLQYIWLVGLHTGQSRPIHTDF